MGGVYGDMLAFFPELLRPYDIFKMAPKVGAGYGPRETLFTKDGYFSRNKGGKEGIVSDSRTENQQATWYCADDIPRGLIRQGLYLEDDGEIYQFVLDNAYTREGGFVRHNMQYVPGNNGQQESAPQVNQGLGEYS